MSLFESYKGIFFYGQCHLSVSILITAVSYLPNFGGVSSYEGLGTFLITSGVLDLMCYNNGNRSLLPWHFNNPKGVGPSWNRSKTLS